jgi:glycogen debranching enzyme
MPIAFDRSVCCDLNETISREWLITNGRGGYAAGTVAGVLTRMEHGLLVASLQEVATPQLLLAKIDEEIVFDQRTYYLGTNEYRDGMLNPSGFVHLETFHLEEGFPVFTYRLGGIDGILLEKRIWMAYDHNTTYIQYRLRRAEISSNPYDFYDNTTGRAANKEFGRYNGYSGYPEAAQRVLNLTLLPFSAYRPHDQPQYGNNDWHFQVQVHSREQDTSAGEQEDQLMLPKGVAGCTIRAWDGVSPYSIFAVGHPDSQTTFIPTGVWYWHFLRRHDQAAGRPAIDDLYLPGVIRAKLWPGDDSTLTIIASTEELSSQLFRPSQINLSYKRSVEDRRNVLQPQRYFGEGGETSYSLHVLPLSATSDLSSIEAEEFLGLLLQAADHFLVRRVLPQNEHGDNQPFFFSEPEHTPVVLSDYYGMQDCTRDTLIALPGLLLAPRRYDEARRILRNLARFFKQGMLPDRLPLPGLPGHPLEESNYGSMDTTLWYFYALDHYLRATNDYELLDELYQRLVDSIDWYIRGTYNGIHASDGLLGANKPGKALTWMNASINGVPVTPRPGKPVEVNALWYHALSLMHEWSQWRQKNQTSSTPALYEELSIRCKESFHLRFWYAFGGYLYDGVDGPNGDDTAFRPNQLLALSLRYPVLDKEHWQAVFDLVTQRLITPYGLRTLAPQEAGYQGQLKGNQEEQLRALHQGSAWPWLIGPYIDALLNIQASFATPKRTSEYWWQKSFQMLEPFRRQFQEGLLATVGGIYDGDAPQHAEYNVTSVLSVSEILRIYNLLAQEDARQAASLTLKKNSSAMRR